MGKYLGPRLKLSRAEGFDLGHVVRDVRTKCNLDVRPGMHGGKRVRSTDYALQLREKQKLKRIYNLREGQFRSYYKAAAKGKTSTVDNLMVLLESRLDNIVYRAGFAATRAEARQIVSHKGIQVDGKLVNIPSYQVAPGQVISLTEKAKKQDRVKFALELAEQRGGIEWMAINKTAMSVEFKALPDVEFVSAGLNVQLIVELYSK